MTSLVALPVLLPLLAAGLCLVLGRSAFAQRTLSLLALGAVVVVAGVLVAVTDTAGPQVLSIGGWGPDGIVLVADRLSSLLLLVSSIVTLCVLAYAHGQGIVEAGPGASLSVFHPTFLVLCAGVSNAFLTGDLFNLYVSVEILLVSSYVLITLGATRTRVRAGMVYVVVSLLSSVLLVTGLAALYSVTGTVNLADAAVKLQSVGAGTRDALQAVLLTAFGVKAAIFPVSAWLPDSYPTAPAPVTAVFAGLLTKVGVYAMVRVQTLLFPDNPRSELFLVLGMATMLIGILGAISQSDIKRILSFTLVSHVGFVLVGLGLFTRNGLAGALFYVVHHITTQTSLFLLAGLIEYRMGTTDVDRLGGLARLAPVLAGAFLVPALSLGGIPPLSGFLGKLAVLQAGVQEGSWLALGSVAVGLLTSLLTLYALAKVWSQAFWRPAPLSDADARSGVRPGQDDVSGTLVGDAGGDRSRVPLALSVPAYALVAVGLAFTAVAGPLYDYAVRSADELRAPASYVTRVLGGAE